MTLTPKQIVVAIVAVVVSLGLAYSAGRWAAPAKVIEKEKVVEKRVEVIDQVAITNAVNAAKAEWKKNEVTHTKTEIKYLEGKVVEKIIYVDREVASSGNASSTNTVASTNVVTSTVVDTKETTKEKITEAKTDRYKLSLSANLNWNKVPTGVQDVTWEARGEMRLIGGLWGGVTVTPQLKMGGLTLGFQF